MMPKAFYNIKTGSTGSLDVKTQGVLYLKGIEDAKELRSYLPSALDYGSKTINSPYSKNMGIGIERSSLECLLP